MSLDVLRQAVDELRQTWPNSLPAIQVTGNGEPLMHSDAIEAITYPAEKGFNVGLTTNGVLLNKKATEAFCRAGVGMINVSLDAATPETYAIVRPTRFGNVNFHSRVVRNIQDAVAVRDRLRLNGIATPTEIMITMIVRPLSESEKESFVKLGADVGVDKISFRPINSTAGLTPLPNQIEHEVSTNPAGVITHVDGQRRWACHFPFKRMNFSIGEGGAIRVTYCPHGWDQPGFDVGNYPATSLKGLWEGGKFEEIRQAHLLGNIDPNSPCASCIDWHIVTRTGQSQATYAEIIASQKGS